MKVLYESHGITLLHGNALELEGDASGDALVTGPPWYEQPATANEVVARLCPSHAIYQWTELGKPPCPLPLIGVYAWVHSTPGRFQPFFHFATDCNSRMSDTYMARPVTSDHPDYIGHPHQVPIKVMEWLIQKVPPNLTIIDPFAGSGTTLVAARQLGRKAVGIELDGQFAEMALKRLKAMR